jgi:2-methylcitrate dehydratase PrpD
MSDNKLHSLVSSLLAVDYQQFPPPYQDFLKRDILDSLGAAVAGSSRRLARTLAGAFGDKHAGQRATLLGSWGSAEVRDAALINGTCAHAWELDDTYEGGGAPLHAGGIIVSSALTMADARGGVSGKQFLEAVGAALEFECRLARATVGGLGGWHLTSVYGYFGSAMACCRILGLTPEQTLHALGISFAQASGNLAATADAADTKALQAGLAATGGTLSAILAGKGVTGPLNSFDGPRGLFALYHKGVHDPAQMYTGVLQDWVALGIGFKPWPSCRYTQGYLTALMDLRQRHQLDADMVREIRLPKVFGKFIEPREVKVSPRNAVDAQFSVPYTLACMLQKGTMTIADLQDNRLRDPELIAIAQRILPDGEAPASEYGKDFPPAVVTAHLHDGRVLTETAVYSLGHPGKRPLDYAAVSEKFRACVQSAALPPGKEAVEQVVAAVARLETIPNVRELIQVMSRESLAA